jgi:hypothetical protein
VAQAIGDCVGEFYTSRPSALLKVVSIAKARQELSNKTKGYDSPRFDWHMHCFNSVQGSLIDLIYGKENNL